MPLHLLPCVGVWSAKFRVPIVYIIICGFIWSVATTHYDYLINSQFTCISDSWLCPTHKKEAGRIHKDQEDAEVEQLWQERENYETTKKRNHDSDHSNQMDSNAIQECKVAKHHTTHRCEHYNSWLSLQLILNSICANEIYVVGGSAVPDCMKQPIYPGYPWSEPSDHMDRDATTGPNHPQGLNERQQHDENTCDDGRGQKSNMPQCNIRHTTMGNSPSHLSDGLASDSTYRPQQSESMLEILFGPYKALNCDICHTL